MRVQLVISEHKGSYAVEGELILSNMDIARIAQALTVVGRVNSGARALSPPEAAAIGKSVAEVLIAAGPNMLIGRRQEFDKQYRERVGRDVAEIVGEVTSKPEDNNDASAGS